MLNWLSCCIGFSLAVRNIIKASENALALEKRRRQIYEELSAKDNGLKGSANQVNHYKEAEAGTPDFALSRQHMISNIPFSIS